MDGVTVVVAHSERATPRVGDVFLKVDVDQARSLLAVRPLIEQGFDPFAPGCEVDVLRSRM